MTCLICGKEICEGDGVVVLEEGYCCSGDIVDKECHYITHASCLFRAVNAACGQKEK